MSKKSTFRGLSQTRFIWHGEYSDPEIEFKGRTFNYWAVENSLWEYFKEDENVNEADWDDDEAFDQWLKDNEDWVYTYLDEFFLD